MSSQIIIGIDFGTTYSGCSWLHTGSPKERHNVVTWPDGISTDREGESSGKVPTEILYEMGGFKWGFEIPQSVARHQWFKLELDPSQVRTNFGVAANLHNGRALPPGYSISAEKMVTDYLSALRQHVDSHLGLSLPPTAFVTTKKSYCLTVPAVWSDSAMRKTRDCALAAGMSDLVMVTEPEAAAMYTLDALKPHDLKIGSSFVLCDAGGGTVDLISYEIKQLEPNLELVEVAAGSGGLCGSVFINRLFESHLQEKFGRDPDWDNDILAEASEWFERIKRSFKGDLVGEYKVPVGLADNAELGIRRGRVQLSGRTIDGFFKPVIQEVIRMVKRQIATMQPKIPDSVLLVGGFGQSNYLRQCLRGALANTNINVSQPPNGWTAVVEGALMKALAYKELGTGNVQIRDRVARKYYGVSMSVKFDSQKHARWRKWWDSFYGYDKVSVMCWIVSKESLLLRSCENFKLTSIKGEIVRESQVNMFAFHRTCVVEAGHPEFLTSNIEYCVKDLDLTRPVYPSLAQKLVRLTADMRAVPVTDFRQDVGADGKRYYRINYSIGATFYSAYTKYELYFNGEVKGSVTAEYV